MTMRGTIFTENSAGVIGAVAEWGLREILRRIRYLEKHYPRLARRS
jgi:hypothetical protein